MNNHILQLINTLREGSINEGIAKRNYQIACKKRLSSTSDDFKEYRKYKEQNEDFYNQLINELKNLK